MKSKLVLFFLIFFSLSAICQDKKTTIENIQNTLQNYFDGYIERDVTKLNKAFDIENGTMKIPVKKEGKTIGYKNAYFKDLMPIWGSRKKLSKEILKNCILEILNIDVVDQKIASAKISMKVDTITYIDIVALQKINNNWKITNKIYLVRK